LDKASAKPQAASAETLWRATSFFFSPLCGNFGDSSRNFFALAPRFLQ